MCRLSAFIILTLTMAAFVAPAAATVNGATRTFAYDARGNVTNNGRYVFAYDFANQPVSQTGAANASFAYDGNVLPPYNWAA